MTEANGALVSLYTQRNTAIKNKGDVAGLNAKITKYVEDNNISQAERRASSVAASNVQSNNKGADVKKKTKKVPVISIGVGMAEMRKGKSKDKKSKTAMMRGGMANGKQHMYAAGGMVNDGLKALAKTRPDVVAKILK